VSDPKHPNLRTTANTPPVIHAGRLYATKEDGLPHAIDPRTLATLGPTDFGGTRQSQAFTAHPKIDPLSGEMVAFGYETDGLASRRVFLSLFDRAGKLTRDWRFDVPHTSLMHDMAFTQRHVIVIGGGGATSLERLHQGKLHWAWDFRKPCYFGIVPRDGDVRDIRWFFGGDQSVVHTANAWSEGDKVILDAPIADGNTWPWFEDLGGRPFHMQPFSIRRLTLDMSKPGDRPHEAVLFDTAVTSFARIDERFLTLPYRYIWVQFADTTQPFRGALPDDPRQQPVTSLGRFDVIDGKQVSWFAGDHHALQEPTFVPRPGGTAEGDGSQPGIAAH
jgi:carotenoid cleavage dioxygenase-like enzyme